MSALLARLRQALAPRFEVDRQLASGGMGLIFHARHVALNQPVAIKVMRPEQATAVAAERFLREARVLASLSHSHIVPVHDADEADGLFYYVMDYMEGETLEARLKRGPLSVTEAVKLGRDLLDALEAVHRRGVIHRDIKPANIFLDERRALLGDFGIAKALSEDSLTATGVAAGTPAYMPPEQRVGSDLTPQTDLYAVGMVLYEALTGHRWDLTDESAAWRGVPFSVRRVLKRALHLTPSDRWPDAVTFRRALWHTRTRRYRQRAALLTVGGAALGIIGALLPWCEWTPSAWICGGRSSTWNDLAIVPLRTVGDRTGQTGEWIVLLAEQHLQPIPQLHLTPPRFVANWFAEVTRDPGSVSDRVSELRARRVTQGTLAREGDTLDLSVALLDRDGNPVPGSQQTIRDAADRWVEIGYAWADYLLRSTHPHLADLDPAALTANRGALREYLHGEAANNRNQWHLAIDHYQAAVALDPDFAMAWLRLHNVWRWIGVDTQPSRGLQDLITNQADRLGDLGRRIVEAQLMPAGADRLAVYRAAYETFVSQRRPIVQDATAAHYYGDELFNRGPLMGIPLDEAVRVLEEAAAIDSIFAPTYVLLSLAHLRLGRCDAAERAVTRLASLARPTGDEPYHIPSLLELGYGLRCGGAAGRALAQLDRQTMDFAVRWGLGLDAPEAQEVLARLLLASPRLADAERANAHEARGLALVALGRPAEAHAEFDSVSALVATTEAELRRWEWRIVTFAVTPSGPLGDAARAATERLAPLLSVPGAISARAAFAIALYGYIVGDSAIAASHHQQVASHGDADSRRLDLLLQAVAFGRRQQWRDALDVSSPLIPYNADAGERRSDPFARSLLYMSRGSWFERLGLLQAAEASWIWHQAQDLVGYPSGLAQQGEVDWAFGTLGRFRQARAAVQRGHAVSACESLSRVVDRWARADPSFLPLAADAATLRATHCVGAAPRTRSP